MPDSRSDSKTKAWLWVLGGLVAVLAIALVVVLVTRDNGGSSQADSTTTSSSSTTAAPTTAAPTTTAPAPSTTQPYPVITQDPQTYAQYLFVAWQNNNQTNAANVASAEAIQQMFAQPYSASAGWQFDNCSAGAGSVYCTWKASAGTQLVMQVRNLTGGLPIQVLGVTRS